MSHLESLKLKLEQIRPFNVKIEFKTNKVYFQETKYSVEWLYVGIVEDRLEALDICANWLERNDMEENNC